MFSVVAKQHSNLQRALQRASQSPGPRLSSFFFYFFLFAVISFDMCLSQSFRDGSLCTMVFLFSQIPLHLQASSSFLAMTGILHFENVCLTSQSYMFVDGDTSGPAIGMSVV